jgi:head-tail adaptor
MSLQALLNKTCSILTRTETQSSTGEVTKNWVEAYAGVVVQVQPNREPVLLQTGYTVTVKDFVFYFLPDQQIEEHNRIVVGSAVYEIVGIVQNSRGSYTKAYGTLVDFRDPTKTPTVITKSLVYRTTNQ